MIDHGCCVESCELGSIFQLCNSRKIYGCKIFDEMKFYDREEGNHQQAELDIVALRLNENILDIIEVKRNPEKFNKRLLEDKVDFFSSKEKTVRKNR